MKFLPHFLLSTVLLTVSTFAAAERTRTFEYEGCEFQLPADWTGEKMEGGLLFLAPRQEYDWQANIFLEVSKKGVFPSLDRSLAKLSAELQPRKQGYAEISRRVGKLPSGLAYGVIEYTAHERPKLHDLQIVIELSATQHLYVLMSSADKGWSEYSPAFQTVLASFRKKAAARAPASAPAKTETPTAKQTKSP